MTYFKKSTALFLGLMLATATFAQQGAERTLVKSFNMQGQSAVLLNLDAPMEVETWSNPTVRVQMNIKVNNRPDSFLKSMITAGRYNLKSELNDNGLTIYAPGMERKVKLRGEELQEAISYVVLVPEDIHVIQADAATSAIENSNLEAGIK